jgi:hypothetical protein
MGGDTAVPAGQWMMTAVLRRRPEYQIANCVQAPRGASLQNGVPLGS